jgi:hypothetical protein
VWHSEDPNSGWKVADDDSEATVDSAFPEYSKLAIITHMLDMGTQVCAEAVRRKSILDITLEEDYTARQMILVNW